METSAAHSAVAAVEAASDAAAQTAAVVAAVEANAADAIAAAQAETAQAEANAAALAAAALEGQRGEHIANIERSVAECRTLVETFKTELMNLIAPLQAQVAELLSRPQTTVVLPSGQESQSLTPPLSATAEKVETVAPPNNQDGGAEGRKEAEIPPVRRRMRLL